MYKVYKILDKETGECYIGHSKNMTNRMAVHRSSRNCSSRDIMTRDNYDLIILEYDIPDKETARERERYYYDITDNVINTNRPLTTQEERVEDGRKSTKACYYRHHDIYKERKRKYKQDNKEEIKARRAVITECQCGAFITSGYKHKHIKKAVHFKLLTKKKMNEAWQIWQELLSV